MAFILSLVLEKLLVLVVVAPLGSCASTWEYLTPTVDKMSPRLTNGSVVSEEDYGAYGASAVGVGVTNTGTTYMGVMTSSTQFTAGRGGLVFTNVSVGSRYYALDPQFDGQILQVIGAPTTPIGAPLAANFTSSEVTQIPPGSKATPALTYPSGTAPPGEGAECLAYGYSGPAAPFLLNTRPAIITNVSICNATYSTFRPDGSQFCAIVSDASGGDGYCGPRDAVPIVFCLGWAAKRGQIGSLESRRVGRWCLLQKNNAFCAWLCHWSPYCLTSEDEPSPSWYLAGLFTGIASLCNNSSTKPILFDLVTLN